MVSGELGGARTGADTFPAAARCFCHGHHTRRLVNVHLPFLDVHVCLSRDHLLHHLMHALLCIYELSLLNFLFLALLTMRLRLSKQWYIVLFYYDCLLHLPATSASLSLSLSLSSQELPPNGMVTFGHKLL
jgi:hypothetical protein